MILLIVEGFKVADTATAEAEYLNALALLAQQPLGQHAPAMELTSAPIATLDII